MASRYTSESFTSASVSAGATLNINRTALADKMDLFKIKVVPDAPGGSFDFKIYKADTFAAAKLLAFWDDVAPNLYYPMDISSGVPAEGLEGPAIPYDDDDASSELHLQVINNDGVAHTYTVTILWEIPGSGSGLSGLTVGRVLIAASATTAADDADLVFDGSILFIGDTSNAGMTKGLTINQGASGDEAIALKSSDIAHGMTGIAETDTYGLLMKYSDPNGGLMIRAFSQATTAFLFSGVHTTDDTTKSTGGAGCFVLEANLKSGVGGTTCGANANLVSISNAGLVRFIFDAEGDSHQDVGTAWTNFDELDDVGLLNGFAGIASRQNDPLRSGLLGWAHEHRAALVTHRIVTINDGAGEDGSIFVNWSRMHMLEIGAIRQLGARVAQLERKLLEV